MLHALYTLIAHGDYTPELFPLLGHEDSALVDIILTITGR